MSRFTRLLTTAAASALFHACDTDKIAGTNNETQTRGTFYRPDGKPAVGARVRVYAATQRETDTTTDQIAQTYVNADGNVTLKLKAGHYSLIADDQATGRALFIDSAFSDGDKIDLPVDTLRPTGTLTGHIRVQPMHSPSIAWVHLMRTNLYANVDSTGFFRISGVPAGNLDLVAVSHLQQYTPTHKLVRALPDSTVDVDTIGLVYNGLPLVTGIVASYDSLTGVVTVGWKDTAYARKSGYLIFKQEGAEKWLAGTSQGNSPVGAQFYSTTNSLLDTIFPGWGDFGRILPYDADSLEKDLTYWVGAAGTDRKSEGPLWEKVRIHVKSPALARRWDLRWGQTVVSPSAATDLDTIEAGLVAWTSAAKAVDPEERNSISILGSDGTWRKITLPVSASGQDPVFWGGRVWYADLFASTRFILDSSWTYMGDPDINNFPRTPVYDSVRIRSSADGAHWDTTRLATGNDSTTSARIIASSGRMYLEFAMHQYRSMPGIFMTSSLGGFVLEAGTRWAPTGQLPEFVRSQSSNWVFSTGIPSEILPTPAGDWTLKLPTWPASSETPNYILFRGQGTDSINQVFESRNPIALRGIDSLVAIQRSGSLGLAKASDPLRTQWVASSLLVKAFTFWHGQLVVLMPSGITMGNFR